MHLAGFRKSNCTTGKSRICVMRKLPVVPLCRRPAVLLETPNQKHLSRVPPPQEGRIAIVTDVGSGMRWTREGSARDERADESILADGQVAWS